MKQPAVPKPEDTASTHVETIYITAEMCVQSQYKSVLSFTVYIYDMSLNNSEKYVINDTPHFDTYPSRVELEILR